MSPIDKFPLLRICCQLLLGTSRKTRIISASALFLAVCAFGAAGVAPMAPDVSDLPIQSLSQELSLPQLSDQIAELSKQNQRYVSEERIRSGDTLAALMMRLGVDDEAAANFIRSDTTARAVLHLKAGKRVRAQVSDDGELDWLSASVAEDSENQIRNIVIQRSAQGFKAYEQTAKLESRKEMRTGEIRSSLFAATDNAQIPDSVATQIVDLFSTDIDFASDLRRGDRFNVVYETFWLNGEFVRAGRILAAEFTNAGTTHQSVWYSESNNPQGGGYYGFDGKSLKKAFLKSPLEFSRISSGFAMRVHPISGQWKQHKGVDFAAPTGTPIRAAADGTIDFAGMHGGYGNMVVLKHWDKYSTAYAHMSRFADGVRRGSRVAQGQIIGFVGSTGWSTGPHLHYEFRVNDEPRDPLSIHIPNAQALTGSQLQRFRANAQEMAHRLALLSPSRNNVTLASK